MRIVAALLFASTAVFAQTADTNTCSLDGAVVNSVTHAPILRAHIAAVSGGVSATADSDQNGKWRFDRLACGAVTLSAARPGFLRFAKRIAIPASAISLELIPQSVLAGRVGDDQGDPIQGARVTLLTARILNGRRGILASDSMATNDLGEYRFAGLTAGKYFLCANASGGPVAAAGTAAFGERCYPGPLDSGVAGALPVAAGYEGRVDFILSPLVTFDVSGIVSGEPEGYPSSVDLTPRLPAGGIFMGRSARTQPGGAFTVRNVPPGAYTIVARSTRFTGSRLAARAPLDVGASNVEGIQLALESGFTVSGAVNVITVSGVKPVKPRYTVLLRSAEGSAGPGPSGWNDDRTAFTIDDVMPGNYRLEFSPPPPFYLRSATVGGRSITGAEVRLAPGSDAIEITISDDGGAVEGEVTADDAPAPGWVYLEKDGAPSRNAQAGDDGRFRIDALPPGDYKVYAWDDNTKVEYANPDWMQRNGKPASVTVGPGQTAEVKLVRQIAPE